MTTRTCILLIAGAALLAVGCGSKQLSVEDYNRLPSEDRIAYLEQRVQKKPDDALLKKELFEEYLAVGNEDRALAVMEQYLQMDPNQPDVQFQYGELQYKKGDYPAAYRSFLAVMQGPSANFYLNRVATYAGGSYTIQAVTSSTADEAYPSFSPDGKKIVYQKKSGESWDIYEVDLESRAERPLVTTPADEELPVYQKNENAIIFSSTAADRRPINRNYKVREIVRMALSDGYTASLTRSFADDWLPRSSNDGVYIAFVSDRDDLRKVSYVSKQSDIFIMENDGDFQQQLTESTANDGGPAFSADDRHIFHSDRNGNYDVFVMRRDGSQVLTVVDSPGNDVNPAASPNGDYIAFVSDRGGNYEIYRSRTDGSALEQLTFHPANDANPVFSPDGKLLAFHSNRSGNFDIYVVNLTSGMSELTVQSVVNRLQTLTR